MSERIQKKAIVDAVFRDIKVTTGIPKGRHIGDF
jgi:hypothetical protein